MVVRYVKFFLDLFFVLLLTDLAILFVLTPPFNQTPLRVVFAFVLLLFLPGYVLTCAIFPRKELGCVERFTISVGLSIAITAFDGFAINFSPWYFRPGPIVISLSIIIAFLVLLTLMIRLRTPEDDRYYLDMSILTKHPQAIPIIMPAKTSKG